jgi:hypothetical protein
MKNIFFCLSTLLIISCSNQSSQKQTQQTNNPKTDTSYVWKKLLDSAEWKKNYNFQLFSHRDTLWTFHPDGNWFTVNGTNWIKSSLPNSISNLAFLDYVQFNNAIYGLGHFEGSIEQFTLKSSIYRTTDMRNWERVAEESNLPKRFFYHPFVFNNKIWIIGGEDKNTQYSDIWNSGNGINWVKQKDTLPFGKRSGSQIVLLNNKLFLLDNDVWASADALNWEKVTDEIITGEKIFGYNAVVFDNKIWLLGCNRNGQFSSQVLVSADGKTWQGQNAPWTPRGGIAATVYKEKIFMTGGKYGGTPDEPDFRYSNDVWTLVKNQ